MEKTRKNSKMSSSTEGAYLTEQDPTKYACYNGLRRTITFGRKKKFCVYSIQEIVHEFMGILLLIASVSSKKVEQIQPFKNRSSLMNQYQ